MMKIRPIKSAADHEWQHAQQIPNADPARHMVALATDDLAADWKRLKEAGVEFVEDPKDYGDLSVATLKDPEGNLVQLRQYRPS